MNTEKLQKFSHLSKEKGMREQQRASERALGKCVRKGKALLIYLSDDQVQKCFENQFFVLFIVLFFFLAKLSFFFQKSCSTYGYAFMFCREYEKDDGLKVA